MVVRRLVGLLGTVAAGLLVSAAALPALAGTAPTLSAPAEGAQCTTARSAEMAYRVGTIAPLADEWGVILSERQERYDDLEEAADQARRDFDAAQEALTAAQGAEAEAEAALEAARTGGDAGEIEAAEGALAAATEVRVLAGQTLVTSRSALHDTNDAVDAYSPVLAQARGTAMVLFYSAQPGQGFETEESVGYRLQELRSLDEPRLLEYMDLLQALADACFPDEDDGDEDTNHDEEVVVVVKAPPAPAAEPVTARAGYTG